MSDGTRVLVRSEDGLLLAVREEGEAGWCLPGGPMKTLETAKAGAARHLLSQCGVSAGEMFPIHRGKGDMWKWTSTYEARGTSGEPRPREGLEIAWVGMHEILCGRWGLYARDVFNKMGWMKRPALDLARLYKLSKIALNDRVRRDGAELEGVDLVIDEVHFLIDINKRPALDDILRRIDVELLHADILDALVSMVEEVPGLEAAGEFVTRARARLALVDSLRTKIRLVVDGRVVSTDVRGDAAKIYKQRAAEFGRMLRDGTLGVWMAKRRELMMQVVAENKARQAKRRDEESHPDPTEGRETRNKPSVGKLRYGAD